MRLIDLILRPVKRRERDAFERHDDALKHSEKATKDALVAKKNETRSADDLRRCVEAVIKRLGGHQ